MEPFNQHFGRRAFLGAVPAACLLAACSRQSGKAEQIWTQAGTSNDVIDHSFWDALLAKYVKPSSDGVNRVDYAAFKTAGAAALKRYLAVLQKVEIEQFPKAEQFSFWVNLYNAATINVILTHYPLASIKDIGLLGQGPWKEKVVKISGKDLSLDDVEHGILRPVWKDVRIHYAVNCASIGCPNLATRAYTADRLDVMLEEAARSYINHPRGFARVEGKLVASSIFDWYVDDWGDQLAVLDHAREYAMEKSLKTLGAATAIDSHDYNWSLNDTARSVTQSLNASAFHL